MLTLIQKLTFASQKIVSDKKPMRDVKLYSMYNTQYVI